MKWTASVFALALLALTSAAPAPEPAAQPAAAPADDSRPEIIEIIAPAANAQETLATLNLGAPGSELSERNKRTIGILRQLFPSLTQIIEQKVQQITSFVLRTFGPVFLRAFLGGRGGGAAGGGAAGGGSGTVELEDDDDDDDDEPVEPKVAAAEPGTTAATATTTTAAAPAAAEADVGADADTDADAEVEANTDKPEDKEDKNEIETKSEDEEEEERRRRRKRALFLVPNAIVEENQLLSGAESQQAEVRVAFDPLQQQQQPQPGAAGDQQTAASEDQQTAAAANNPSSIDEISLDDADDSEENRNKRFLSFGGSSGGGGGGGSGNFLFDIVRQAPAAMARAAGSAFRLFAGTDSLNVGLTASHTASLDPSDTQLVAGSSSGSSGAGEGGAEAEDGAAKGDNLTEGVPGPVTRLFIIANRGIANLIQDLILRIAQTSERIVNFKARLITSII